MNGVRRTWTRSKPWWLGIAAGAGLGCIYRFLFHMPSAWGWFTQSAMVMTLAYLAFVPLAIGYIAVDRYLYLREPEQIRWYEWIFLPWASVFVALGIALLLEWEGKICVLLGSPIMLVFAFIGGVAARLGHDRLPKPKAGTLSALAMPLFLIAIEIQVPQVPQYRSVETTILIHAPAVVVWDNIKSVRAISTAELPRAWVTSAGFPKPIAATLSHEGIGGVRQASFTGGLIFTETVNYWEPLTDLRFSIHTNTDAIPASTFDEHVTIGGAFFDVLDGEYRLEPRSNGTLLRLTSRERVSTHFNPYAGFWTDAVMRSVQDQILFVIRNRCEQSQFSAGLGSSREPGGPSIRILH